MKRRTHRVESTEAGQPLAQLVERIAGAPGAALVERGAVYVRGKRARDPAVRIAAGDVLTVVLEERGRDVLAAPAPRPTLEVLFEDASIIAVNKPAGVTAQPTPGGEESLPDFLRERLGHEPGLVHRLDRETSGVTVFAKTPEATSALALEFREGRARKQYLAICGPALEPQGIVDLPLSRDPSRPGRFRATEAAHGVSAETHFLRLGAFEDHAIAALFPKTGRTHQLRAHLTALNAPICGDARYGGAKNVNGSMVERCLLHAHVLEVRHPDTGAPLRLIAPLPPDMRRIFEQDGVPIPESAFE